MLADAIADGHIFASDLFLLIAVILFVIATFLAARPVTVRAGDPPHATAWVTWAVIACLGLACLAFGAFLI